MANLTYDDKNNVQNIKQKQNLTLTQLLEQQNVELLQLFNERYIYKKIIQSMQQFIKYCQKHEQFSFDLINTGLKCDMRQHANENMRNANYIAVQILTSDHDIIADLLVIPNKRDLQKNKNKNNQQDSQSEQFQKIQQIQQTIVTQVLSQPNTCFQQILTAQQQFYNKYRNLLKVMEYIDLNQTKNIDQNCINYIVKALNCLIRKKSRQFFNFFIQKKNLLHKLISLNQFNSINQLLIKLLSQDQLNEKQYIELKNIIVSQVIQIFKNHVDNEDFSERLEFLDQLFQQNKYPQEHKRTQLQQLSDNFVTQQIIQYFVKLIMQPNTVNQFINSINYLSTIVKRMNSDQQVDSDSNDQQRPVTMLFQLNSLFISFKNILESGFQNLKKFTNQNDYKKRVMTLGLYQLLATLTKSSRFQNNPTTRSQSTIQNQNNKQSQNKLIIQSRNKVQQSHNVIIKSRQQKMQIMKLLILQHKMQKTTSGLNKLYLITIITQILSIRIYQKSNNLKQQPTLQKSIQIQSLNQSSDLQRLQSKIQINLSSEQQTQKTNYDKVVEQLDDINSKKNKINKFKLGLKLNVKKFSFEKIGKFEQVNIPVQKKQLINTNTTASKQISDIQTKLTVRQSMELLEYYSNLIQQRQNRLIINKLQNTNEKKTTYNKAEWVSLANKLILSICISTYWPQSTDQVTRKNEFLQKLQQLFISFSLKIVKNQYTVTLATKDHPNKLAKQRNNPQLCFIQKFISIYKCVWATQTTQPVPQPTNKQLIDSDFKSQEDQSLEDGFQDSDTNVLKCKLVQQLTGFRFVGQNQNNADGIYCLQEHSVQNNKAAQIQQKQHILKIRTVISQQVDEASQFYQVQQTSFKNQLTESNYSTQQTLKTEPTEPTESTEPNERTNLIDQTKPTELTIASEAFPIKKVETQPAIIAVQQNNQVKKVLTPAFYLVKHMSIFT